ncbi:KilA-N domain-containing protein [Marinomonas balearica]|uniref:KilA-N domain-containing protein n=1 Tax=Marinomonas balearica TaxID=491947 RepID=UPI002441A889|nr:KilA-N domain-containing protein [Marinomonas balearica]
MAEIDIYANSHSLALNKNLGRSGGTWVCKELVYVYAMWISPKFNLEVIRAFDQAQTEQPPEPTQQSLPAPIQDDEKLKLINDVAKSLGITESIAVVSATDIMAMIQTNPAWVDQTIERVKTATGRGFGDGI